MLAIFEPVPLGLLDLVIGVLPAKRMIFRRTALPSLEDHTDHYSLVAVLRPEPSSQLQTVVVARPGEPAETVLDKQLSWREGR